MHKSHVIEIDGNFVGAALADGSKVRFVAVDVRLDGLDGGCWPTLEELRRAVRRGLAEAAAPRVPVSPNDPRRSKTMSRPDGRERADPGIQRAVSALREQVRTLASASGVPPGIF